MVVWKKMGGRWQTMQKLTIFSRKKRKNWGYFNNGFFGGCTLLRCSGIKKKKGLFKKNIVHIRSSFIPGNSSRCSHVHCYIIFGTIHKYYLGTIILNSNELRPNKCKHVLYCCCLPEKISLILSCVFTFLI